MIYAQTENHKGGGARARTAVGHQGAMLPHCLGCPQVAPADSVKGARVS